jgi:two-component system, NarL family, response regulator DesR
MSRLVGCYGRSVRILIADDQRLFAEALRVALDGYGIDVIGIAYDGEEAIRLTHELQPDVVVLDIDMPRLTGLEVMDALRASDSPVRITVLTGDDSPDVLRRAIECGATTFLRKSQSLDEIAEGVHLCGVLSAVTAPSNG